MPDRIHDIITQTLIIDTLQEVMNIIETVGEIKTPQQCMLALVKITECEGKLLQIKDIYPKATMYLERIVPIQDRLRAIWGIKE